MNKRIGFSNIGLTIILSCCLAIIFGCAGMQTAEAKQAAVVIAPPAGAKGNAITITGTGFKPGEEIDIVLTLGPGERIGLGTVKVDVITADANGNFEAGSAIPVFAKPGKYNVEVEGSQGSLAKTTLEVTAP